MSSRENRTEKPAGKSMAKRLSDGRGQDYSGRGSREKRQSLRSELRQILGLMEDKRECESVKQEKKDKKPREKHPKDVLLHVNLPDISWGLQPSQHPSLHRQLVGVVMGPTLYHTGPQMSTSAS